MVKVQNISEISPNLPITEFDFYDLYRKTFEHSELGKIRKKLPLREMAKKFRLINKSMKPNVGCSSYFTPEGKVALLFLKMYTCLSNPAVEQQHQPPVVLRCKDRPAASSEELQTSGRCVCRTSLRAEDPTAAGDTGRRLETVQKTLTRCIPMLRATRGRCATRRTQNFCGKG